MFLLGRPPVLRWLGALAVLSVAIWVDLRPPPTALHPFARHDIAAGGTIDAGSVDMVPIVAGSLEPVALPVTAARTITAGDPVLSTDASPAGRPLPAGWWVLELEVPAGTASGASIGVVLLDRPGADVIEGVVGGGVTGGTVGGGVRADGFGATKAVAAFPPAVAADVAAAATTGRMAVMIRGG